MQPDPVPPGAGRTAGADEHHQDRREPGVVREVVGAAGAERLVRHRQAEVRQQRVDELDQPPVVGEHRVAHDDVDLGTGAACSGGVLGQPPDRRVQVGAVRLVHRADHTVHRAALGDDVVRGARLDAPDRDHRGVDRIDGASDQFLQPEHDRGQGRDRVQGDVRVGAVPRLAVHRDVELVRGGVHGSDARADHPAGHPWLHVPADDRAHLVLGEQARGDHVLRAARLDLLPRLEQPDQPHRQLDVPGGLQQRPQRRHVHVVAAGVHRVVGGRPLHSGAFDQGQPVEFRPERHGRARRPDPDQETRVGDPVRLQVRQGVAQPLGGGALGPAQVRVAVQLAAQRPGMRQLVLEVCHQVGEQPLRIRAGPGGHRAILQHNRSRMRADPS